MNNQDDKLKLMEDKIEVFNNKIDELQTKVEKLPRAASIELNSTVTELKSKRSRLEERFEKFKGATDSAYRDLLIGFEIASEDLRNAYESARDRYKRMIS